MHPYSHLTLSFGMVHCCISTLSLDHHRHSMSPNDRGRIPLYGLYISPVSLSWSIFNAEKLCCMMSKRTRKERAGRGVFALTDGLQHGGASDSFIRTSTQMSLAGCT